MALLGPFTRVEIRHNNMDFKFTSYIEHNNGGVTAKVRVYDGGVTTEDEYVTQADGVTRVLQPVTRYRRTGVIGEYEYEFADNV